MTEDLSDFADLLDGGQDATEADLAVRRKRRSVGLLVTAVVILGALGAAGGYVGWALNAPLPEPKASSHTPEPPTPEAVAFALPESGASLLTVKGAEAYLGDKGLQVETGDNAPRPMASITKLITALVVLEAQPLPNPADLGPTIWFSQNSDDLYDKYYVLGASIAPMPNGSSMSQRDALGMMLIPSASNYADAVATWAYGSQGAFLDAARNWLAENGLTDTTIVDPTGISPQNISTPTDLITLGRLAAADPTVRALAATQSITIPSIGAFGNTNDLLGTEGVRGLKTGNLGQNAHNLLYTATMHVGVDEPVTAVGVLLGGATRESASADVQELLASIRTGFHQIQVSENDQRVGHIETPWGDTAEMVIADRSSILTWSDTPITVEMKTTPPNDYVDGEVVGSITWTAGPNTATSDIVLKGSIGDPGEWWRLKNPGQLG